MDFWEEWLDTEQTYFTERYIKLVQQQRLSCPLMDFWEEWLDTGRAEFTKSGNGKRESYELIANWVMEAMALYPKNNFSKKIEKILNIRL